MKENKIKELDLEDLEKVTGGINLNNDCPYFINKLGSPESGKCPDCFYNNDNSCTGPDGGKIVQ